jgi:hypothetical protein
MQCERHVNGMGLGITPTQVDSLQMSADAMLRQPSLPHSFLNLGWTRIDHETPTDFWPLALFGVRIVRDANRNQADKLFLPGGSISVFNP